MHPIVFLPGDVLMYNGRGLFPRLIGWAETARGEAPTYARHIGIIGRGGCLETATRIEALWKVREIPALGMDRSRVQVWRMTGLSYSERHALAAYARSHIGDSYGPLKIALHFGDAILSKLIGGKPYVFRRLAAMDDYPICSWLAAWAYYRALGYEFGLGPNAVAPDDMHDHVVSHPEWHLLVEYEGAA